MGIITQVIIKNCGEPKRLFQKSSELFKVKNGEVILTHIMGKLYLKAQKKRFYSVLQ